MKKILVLAAALLVAASLQAKKKDIARHVIIIGVDGWGSWCMEKADVPFIREKMQEGCYTLSKRTVRPTVSGPNWAATLNGTPAESSGIADNKPGPIFKPVFLTEHGAQPTLFHVLKQERPAAKTGVIAEWAFVLNYCDTLCVDYEKGVDNKTVVEESARYIKEAKPELLFIHIDAVDHAGHAYGVGAPEYYACMTHVDGQIARIVEAVKEAGFYDDCIFILTSDHGHNGRGHGGDSITETETPFVIWGKNVKHGHEITETMIQYDVAATAAKIFHLATPQSWRGVPMDVFTKK